MVLLDARSFVVDVQRRNDSVGDHPRAKRSRGTFGNPALKDELNLFGTTDVEVLPNHFLEEDPSAYRAIEHLGKREFDLENGKLIAVTSLAILGSEGMRQEPQPFA